MPTKKLQTRFEQLINGLAIKGGVKTDLKNRVGFFKKRLKKVSQWEFDPPQNKLEDLSNDVFMTRFWYGGSWDRGVYINKGFDIDIYVIYDDCQHELTQKTLDGEILFSILREDLRALKSKVITDLIIEEKPQYSHAIPIKLKYNNKILKIDCIPAFELPNQYLLAPDGWDEVKKVNLKLEEAGLSKVNAKHDGKATKLIWLMKYWNWYHHKPLKSYIIQRLVEEIFLKKSLDSWSAAVKIFFKESLTIFQKFFKKEIELKDRVYTHKSILHDYGKNQVKKFHKALQKGNEHAKKNQWNELFGEF